MDNIFRKVGQVAEYGTAEYKENRSILTVLESKTVETLPHGVVRTYEFYTRSEGYKISGSCATWTREVFGYRFFLDGSSHGSFGEDKEKYYNLYLARIKFCQ